MEIASEPIWQVCHRVAVTNLSIYIHTLHPKMDLVSVLRWPVCAGQWQVNAVAVCWCCSTFGIGDRLP